jgi:hypothetical protein
MYLCSRAVGLSTIKYSWHLDIFKVCKAQILFNCHEKLFIVSKLLNNDTESWQEVVALSASWLEAYFQTPGVVWYFPFHLCLYGVIPSSSHSFLKLGIVTAFEAYITIVHQCLPISEYIMSMHIIVDIVQVILTYHLSMYIMMLLRSC